MWQNMDGLTFRAIVAGLAFLGQIKALSIDNQLTLIKNDCYERLAIGQRLNPKNVYKTEHKLNTVRDCQMACTQEEEVCRSFSFGIGIKGNSTCELSLHPIKETADLKPIGTVTDTDFDLYIKKMGCKLVVENDHHTHNSGESAPPPLEHVNENLYLKPDLIVPDSKPGYDRPQSDTPATGDIPRPLQQPVYTGEYHVQTLVSVRPQNQLYGEGPEKPPPHTDDRPDYDSRPPSYDSSGPVGNPSYTDSRPPFSSYDMSRPVDKPSYSDSRPPPYDLSRPVETPSYSDSRPPSYDLSRPVEKPSYLDSRPPSYDSSKPIDRPLYQESINTRPLLHESKPSNRPEYARPRPPIQDNAYDKLDVKPPVYDVKPFYDRPQSHQGPYNNKPSIYNDNYQRPPANDRPYLRPMDGPSYGYGGGRPMDVSHNGYHSGGPYGTRPDRPYGMGGYDRPPGYDEFDRPPFRPLYLNNPYDDHRPLFRPRPDYSQRPADLSYGGPQRPTNSEDPYNIDNPNHGAYDRPVVGSGGYGTNRRPERPSGVGNGDPYGDKIKSPPADTNRPSYNEPKKPSKPYDKPSSPESAYNQPSSTKQTTYVEISQAVTEVTGYNSNPIPSYNQHVDKPKDPSNPNLQGGYDVKTEKPSKEAYGGAASNKIPHSPQQKEPHGKPIVTQTTGPNGQTITSIITPLNDAEGVCFRRVLAGKRVANRFVKRALTCERVEDCQRECADEKRFVCEGFNYRLDPHGRAKGECELLDVPVTHLDIGRDLYPDSDYDYYERDRNSSPDCKRRPPSFDGGYHGGNGGHVGGYGNGYDNLGYNYNSNQGHGSYYNRRHDYYNSDRFGSRRPPMMDYGGRQPPPTYYDDGYRTYPGDFHYQHSHHSQHEHENSHSYHSNYHYSNRNTYHQRPNDYGPRYPGMSYLPDNDRYKPYHPHIQNDYKSYEPYLPPNRRYDLVPYDERNRYNYDRERDRNYWGFNKHWDGWGSYGGSYGNFGGPVSDYGSTHHWHNANQNRHDYDYDHYYKNHYYLPPKVDNSREWGRYGGSYGTGGNYHHNSHKHSYDYWGFDKKNDGPNYVGIYYKETLPPHKHYLPIDYDSSHRGYGDYNHNSYHNKDYRHNAITPSYIGSNPTRQSGGEHNIYNFMKDECSLRSATGFRLHKGIIKKSLTVSNLYECEQLCFTEKEFICNSYAFRYTISSDAPSDNCYLSTRNYKELDYYTDFEPDRNFDIYTMNNPNRCGQLTVPHKDTSECFWRVRSGSRLNHKVVRDSLNVKSIVECQIECLKAVKFTCRAFSYRYGSGVIGGSIDNCQLTDWPYHELDPVIQLSQEIGFELYERGSFGHGCEPNHFKIQFRNKEQGTQMDQLCYVGFGSPARLLPQATRKALTVGSELDCKAECSRYRDGTLLHCMSFSFKTSGLNGGVNCYLSDILQRDLLSNVDYIDDRDSWLFAWDNYNPDCIALANKPVLDNQNSHEKSYPIPSRLGHVNDLDTWRIYSVKGWPCKRGSFCRENQETGFWYCELEGGGKNAWDYCCRPDHHCGFSEHYPYQWCYVGPTETQWRKCSDRYFPYVDNSIDRNDVHYEHYPPEHKDQWPPHNSYLPHPKPPVHHYRPGKRPDRPLAPPTQSPPKPSLDEYEMQFDNHFLEPPRPGGFGAPRRWPVSYLHKEMPPNMTTLPSSKFEEMNVDSKSDQQYNAIKNLIEIIKLNDLKNIQYQITNESNTADDILFVKIPLPTNFSHSNNQENTTYLHHKNKLKSINVLTSSNTTNRQNRLDRSSYLGSNNIPSHQNAFFNAVTQGTPVYRRAFITKTNITTHGKVRYQNSSQFESL